MQSTIEGAPAFGYVHVDLEPGESVFAENDAMSSMSSKIDLKAIMNDGFFSALGQKFFGGESFFINRFTNSASSAQRVTLVRSTPGDLQERELTGESLYLQKTAFLARTEGVDIKVKWAGFRSAFAKEGLFRLMATGTGRLWYGAYGGILERQVEGELVVDSGHLVAFEKGITMKIAKAGGFFSSLFGGEGFVSRLRGKGTIYIQTRSITGLASWLNPRFR